MRRNPKRTRPGARRPGFSAAARLVGREPLLADAARLEGALAGLFRRLADDAEGGPDAPRWRQASRLSRAVAEGLTDLAQAVADPPHHPRPTRVRVATLEAGPLADADALARSLAGNGDAPPPTKADVARLAALEGRAVVGPLTRMFALCPSPPVALMWRALTVRRRVLEGLGVGPEGPGACPEPPPRAAHGRAPAAPDTAARATNGREWTADGCVERLNRARRCGLARIEGGRAVFFSARAVPGGLGGIRTGDPVTLRVRRGPLGLAAVRVTPAPPASDAGPPAPVV